MTKKVGDPCPYCFRALTAQILKLKADKKSQNMKKALLGRDGWRIPYSNMDRQIYDLYRLEGETVPDIAIKLHLPEKYVLGMTQLMDERGH